MMRASASAMPRQRQRRGWRWSCAAMILIITVSGSTLLYSLLFWNSIIGHYSAQLTTHDKTAIDLPRADERNNSPTPKVTTASEVRIDESASRDTGKQESEGKNTSSVSEVTLNNTAPTTCRQVYFWGGGKAGSTSLFFTLTRGPGGIGNPQNTGPFVPFEKEPCTGSGWKKWEALTKDTNLCRGGGDSNSYTHILNGCPRETSVGYAKKSMTLGNDPKFLMLIRDPVDRYVSFLNDSVRRGGSRMNIEVAARKPSGLGMTLAKQGAALKNLLSVVKDPKQILIIPMESMSLNTEGVIDAIMDHVGGRRWKRNETEVMDPGSMKLNSGSTDKNYNYVNLSHNTTEILQNVLRQDVQLLESLVGKRFSWSSWARSEDTNTNNYAGEEVNESKTEAWLVTSPVSG